MSNISLQKEEATVKIETPITIADEVKELKLVLSAMSEMFLMIRKENSKKNKEALLKADNYANVLNHDGIPINTFYIGYTKKAEFPYILIVNAQGNYVVGDKTFLSLSSAAEYVSGVRRSGWTFWQTIDGVFLKDLYKP